MVDYFPTEETIRAFTEAIKEIISSVCAEQFEATHSFQIGKSCDYVDLCEKKEVGENEKIGKRLFDTPWII